jgi:hypothetical protein
MENYKTSFRTKQGEERNLHNNSTDAWEISPDDQNDSSMGVSCLQIAHHK